MNNDFPRKPNFNSEVLCCFVTAHVLRLCICLRESKSEFPVTELRNQTKGRSSYNWYCTGIGSLPSSPFRSVTQCSSRALRDKKSRKSMILDDFTEM